MTEVNNKFFEILYPDISSEQKKQKKKNIKKRLLDDEFNLTKQYYLAINYFLNKNLDFSLFRNYKYDKKFCKIKIIIRNIYEHNDMIYDLEDNDSDYESDDFFKKKITDVSSTFRSELTKMEKGLNYKNKDSCHQIKFLNFCYFINSKYQKDTFVKNCCSS
jgi:hypothetical protein